MDRSSEDYWPRVHAHIDVLLDRPIEGHESYLDNHCPNRAMRRDVKSWIAYIYTPTDVLDESVATYARALLDDGPPPARPPLWSSSAQTSEQSEQEPQDTESELKATEPDSTSGLPPSPNTGSGEQPTQRSREADQLTPMSWLLWIGAAGVGIALVLWWGFTS